MKHHRVAVSLLALSILGLAPFSVSVEKLPIGSKAPMAEATMTGTDGEQHSIASAAQANGVVVLFSSNTCPWVKAWQDRYSKIDSLAEKHDVGMLAVNSNVTSRDEGDGRADMRKQTTEYNYPFPYVLDEGATLADAFGATKTPDVFLFDGDLKLVYRGTIDDNARNAEAVEHHYLRTAIEAMTNGNEIDPKITESVGCEIKKEDEKASEKTN